MFARALLIAALLSPGCDPSDHPDTREYIADPDPRPGVELGADTRVAACAQVRVPVTVRTEGAHVWSVRGVPALHLVDHGDAVSFRAPVVNTDTEIELTLTVGEGEDAASGTANITVAPAPDGEGLALGMARGCGPFSLGVASGDPRADSVLLWTALPEIAEPTTVHWVVARDLFGAEIVVSGSTMAEPASGGAVTVEATGLDAGTTYFYQFSVGTQVSVLGRTRTVPRGSAQRVRLAVGSCSSVWSGHFNPYARLAEHDDVDLMIHLGDFVYDFVDAEEEVRMPPGPYPVDPTNRAEWVDRFVYYLSDPDLRRARQAHPWLVIWDNHDSDTGDELGQGTTEVFRQYVPMRTPEADDHRVAWRRLQYGDLVDIFLLDAAVHRVEAEDRDQADILGEDQWSWFESELATSEAAWRVVGTQKLVSSLIVPPVGFGKPSPWDDYPTSRARLHDALSRHDDNVILSGDLHFSIATDFVLSPTDPLYDPEDGAGSVASELLATGITRGNFDETLCGGLCADSQVKLIEDIAEQLERTNPHVAGLELIEHGYATVDLTADETVATYWYSPIRVISSTQTQGPTFRSPRGHNRWAR